MQTLYLTPDMPRLERPCVATLGFFDGVHRGHQALIAQVVRRARALQLPSVVITFDRHPREVLQQDYQPQLLTTLEGKLRRLALTGVDVAVVIPFSREVASLTAQDFMRQVMRSRLHVAHFVIGYDNRFGRGRTDGFADYVSYGEQCGIRVEQGEALRLDGVEVSSSVVRALLGEGEVHLAARCLGYDYTLEGCVVSGYQEGRRMGFPTANLDTSATHQLIPAPGVYATRVCLDDAEQPLPAMTSIGNRPTFGTFGQTVETFIFDFDHDIYSRPLRLSFVRRMRSERRFDNVTQLVDQLREDEKNIRHYFSQEHPL